MEPAFIPYIRGIIPPAVPEEKIPSPELEQEVSGPTFYSVCNNWALKIAGEKKVSIDEAFEIIIKEVRTKASDENKKLSLLKALENVGWENDPLFHNPEEYPYYALACLSEGAISVEQFATIMFHYTCVKYHDDKSNIKSIPLFKLDFDTKTMVVNPLAREIIKQTFNYTSGEAHRLTAEQLDAFFEEMATLPASEQQFFVISDAYKKKPTVEKNNVAKMVVNDQRNSKKSQEEIQKLLQQNKAFNEYLNVQNNSIVEQLLLNDFNPLNYFKEGSQRKRMVPSCAMMQTYLNVKHENPLQINPVFDASPVAAFYENAKNRTRDLALPFIGIDLPDVADTRDALGFDFIYHDFYHANACSFIPPNHISGIMELIELSEELKAEPELSKFVEEIQLFIDQLIDLDGLLYPNVEATPTLFWNHIGLVYLGSTGNYTKSKDPVKRNQEMLEKSKAFASSPFYRRLAAKLKEHTGCLEDLGLNLKAIEQQAQIERAQNKTMVEQMLQSTVATFPPHFPRDSGFYKIIDDMRAKISANLECGNFILNLEKALKRAG